MAEGWFLLRSAAWPSAGDTSQSLSLLICGMDAATLPRPRLLGECAPSSGLAEGKPLGSCE